MNIDGKTRLIGLLGDPVEHTMSPIIHNTISKELGINEVYVPFHTNKYGLEAAVKGAYELNILGLNATVPHKNHIMDFLCDVDDGGRAIGAINTLVRTDNGYKGYNTDMMGLLREIKSYDISLAGKDIIILGAGGAAKAVAYMCMSECASSVYILNRTIEKANDIAQHMNSYFKKDIMIPCKLSDYVLLEQKKYIVFQATSIGLHPNDDDVVIEDDAFYSLVDIGIDLVYTPYETHFMKKCRAAGARAYNGLKMLLYQGIIAYELWNNISVDNSVCDIVYKKLLKRTRNNIVLTGFMGCGKSTIGVYLSEKYGYKFVDTDKLIEIKAGKTISEIFEDDGEAYFRSMERDVLLELSETLSDSVISTGGGLPLSDENRSILSYLGHVVYLDVDSKEVIKRLAGDTTRPLLQGENPGDRVNELMNYRRPLYEMGADYKVIVNGRQVEDIAKEVINGYTKA